MAPRLSTLDAFGIQRETLFLLNTFDLLFEWMVPLGKTARTLVRQKTSPLCGRRLRG